MTYKWIGAALVIAGSGGFGYALASSHRRTAKQLRQLLCVLEDMGCLLEYKLIPLPELCRSSVGRISGPLQVLFLSFAEELERQISPDAPDCMAAALARCQNLYGTVRYLCSELGCCLGVFDLPGQLKGLKSIEKKCCRILKNLECNQELRIKSYKTLGICAGVALAILFV